MSQSMAMYEELSPIPESSHGTGHPRQNLHMYIVHVWNCVAGLYIVGPDKPVIPGQLLF